MARYLVCPLDGDTTTPWLIVCQNWADLGNIVKGCAGVGNPYYAFETLPSAVLGADQIAADFDGAPICNNDPQVNRDTIAALYASPPAVDTRTAAERGDDPPVGVVWAVA